MHVPNPDQAFVGELLVRLGFQMGEANKAYGEVQGNPTTLTILCDDPLALLLAFKIPTPHPAAIALPASMEALMEAGRVEVELEDGMAWLTLKVQSDESAAATQELYRVIRRGARLSRSRLSTGMHIVRRSRRRPANIRRGAVQPAL